MKNIDITGKKFGRLTAIKLHHNKIRNNVKTGQYWLCKCDCGKETIVLKSNLGKSVFSCGCLQKEQARINCSKNFTKHSFEYDGKEKNLVVQAMELNEKYEKLKNALDEIEEYMKSFSEVDLFKDIKDIINKAKGEGNE